MRLLLLLTFVVALGAHGEEKEQKKPGLQFEKIEYNDRIYTRSKKGEIGEEIRLKARMEYIFNQNTSLFLGTEIFPEEGEASDVTRKIEIRGLHTVDNFTFKADFDLNTHYTKTTGDGSSGGMRFGFDQDSEDTFIKYEFDSFLGKFYASLHPFNMDTEVGKTFNSWDVARIYEIKGTPAIVDINQTNYEYLDEKTIPGIVLGYELQDFLKVYGGFGISTFLFPTDSGFDINNATLTSNTWNREEDIGFKAGFAVELGSILGLIDKVAVEGQYAGHTKTVETGSLLQDSGSLYAFTQVFGFIVADAEFGVSRAGKNAYRLNNSRNWFELESTGELNYSDNSGADQDWLGKTDFAMSGRLGLKLSDNVVPYALYRYQGPNFIFRERESAHLLRTADYTESHGGLHRMGVGTYFRVGKFIINPEFEAMIAKNPVFSNSADIEQSRLNSSYRKNDFLLRLKVTYKYDKVTDIFRQ